MLALTLTLLAAWLPATAAQKAPLNILMLASDDLRPEIADPYGVVSAQVPIGRPLLAMTPGMSAGSDRDRSGVDRTSCTPRTSPGWRKLAPRSGSPTARSPSAKEHTQSAVASDLQSIYDSLLVNCRRHPAPHCSRGFGTTGRGSGRSVHTSVIRWGLRPTQRSSRPCRRCSKNTATTRLERAKSFTAGGLPAARAAAGVTICRIRGRSPTGIAISSGTRQCKAHAPSTGPTAR
jgi:hypothetical protein